MERALYVIPHHLNMELLTEFYSISISLKKRTKILVFLACWFGGIAIWSFSDGATIAGCICLLFAFWMLIIPRNLKKRARNYYKRDEDLLKVRTLYLFDDYLVLETVVGQQKTEYSRLKKITESQLGVYIYLSAINAICVPKEAFTPDALEFIKGKVQETRQNKQAA